MKISPLAVPDVEPLRSLSSEDLKRFIEAQGIAAVLLPLAEHTTTVTEAAAALRVAAGQIIKSLVFQAAEEFLLVVNNGLARVDPRKLAACLGMGRKQVRLASPAQAFAVTGYVVGSMPPFGHRVRLPTLVDAGVGGLDVVYGGGGGVQAMMRLTAAELLRVMRAQVRELSE